MRASRPVFFAGRPAAGRSRRGGNSDRSRYRCCRIPCRRGRPAASTCPIARARPATRHLPADRSAARQASPFPPTEPAWPGPALVLSEFAPREHRQISFQPAAVVGPSAGADAFAGGVAGSLAAAARSPNAGRAGSPASTTAVDTTPSARTRAPPARQSIRHWAARSPRSNRRIRSSNRPPLAASAGPGIRSMAARRASSLRHDELVLTSLRRQFVAAMLPLVAEQSGKPPDGRVIKEQALDQSLKHVDQIIVPANVSHLVGEDGAKLRRASVRSPRSPAAR